MGNLIYFTSVLLGFVFLFYFIRREVKRTDNVQKKIDELARRNKDIKGKQNEKK